MPKKFEAVPTRNILRFQPILTYFSVCSSFQFKGFIDILSYWLKYPYLLYISLLELCFNNDYMCKMSVIP